MKSSVRKRVSNQYDAESDSSSDEVETPVKQTHMDVFPRSSERIKSKSKKIFRLPDKSSVFNSIATHVPHGNTVEKLRPRKLINNFTKITHRYNYDRASSDDSENEDFIDDGPLYNELSDDSAEQHNRNNSDKDDDESVESSRSFNLKQRHHLSILESDSDSEDKNSEEQEMKHNSVIIESDSEGNENTKSKMNVSEMPKNDQQTGNDESNNNYKVKLEHNSESSEAELISPVASSTKKLCKTKHKRTVLQSDSDSDDNSSHCRQSKRRVVIKEDEESGTESSESLKVERLYSSNEDDDRLPSQRAQLMASRREAHKSLFEKLNAKRKQQKDK